jgi:hypothetical protein
MDYANMSQKPIQPQNMDQNHETVKNSPFHAIGLNDNMDFLGTQLHIQTENVQRPTPRIITQVFSKGRIVLSKKSEYPANLSDAENSEKISELMRLQHSQVIQDIIEKQKHIQSKPKIQICL